eukprot:4149735-Amphidinium_carterae.2
MDTRHVRAFFTHWEAFLYALLSTTSPWDWGSDGARLALSFQQRPGVILQLLRSDLALIVRQMMEESSRTSSYFEELSEYAAYTVLLDGLLRAVELSAPSLRLLPSLYTTLRERRWQQLVFTGKLHPNPIS